MSGPALLSLYDVFTPADLSAFETIAALPYFNVKLYGAVGDGVADDASAILNAYNAADSAGGGLVSFPAGNYAVSTITLNGTNPVTLWGPGAILTQFVANALSSVITITCSNVTIDGLKITGSIAAGHEADDNIACILLQCQGITIANTTIRNCNLTGKSCAIGTFMGATANSKFQNLAMHHNYIRCLHYGIRIGPYAQNAVVNDTIYCYRNDVQVSAIGGYANFFYARPMQIINTNNLFIFDNKVLGGFSSIETYGGNGSLPRPRQTNVRIVNNTCDGHIGFTQVTGGCCTNNTVDLSLRLAATAGNGTWPLYDNATVLANWGYMAGIESDDNTNCVTSNNTVSNQVGAGIDFGAVDNCSLIGNTIFNVGATATPPYYAHGIWLNYGQNVRATISENTINTCARSGIAQSDVTVGQLWTTCSIVDNKVENTQEHGIHLRYTNGFTVSLNRVKAPNLAASTFNGIDFSATVGGDVIRRVICTDNYIDGGKYGISQTYFEVGENRVLEFVGNVARNQTTAAYNIIGATRLNRTPNGVPTVALAATHLDSRNASDVVNLDPGGVASFAYIDYGTELNELVVTFARNDTTVVHGVNLSLAGSANVIPTAGSVMTFFCSLSNVQTGNTWTEKSRSIR